MELSFLKKKALSGMFWSSIQLLTNRLFAFIIKLVLARLLFPDQFGLVGMAAVFTNFVQVFNDLGIGSALVQRKEESLRDEHFHTAFWTGILWSIGIYLIIFFAVAPLAASFYNEPLLTSIIPVLSIGVLSSPIILVHRAQLTRQMEFKKLAYIENLATVFSGVLAIGLASLGAGVWSLVFNSVASFLVLMPLYFRATHWTPKLIWEKEAFKDVFGFGVFTTGTQFLNVVMLNIDYLLIGKLLNAAALGKYTLAFVLTDTFRNKITVMINRVMYPIYGQKQNDHKALKSYYLKVVKYNSICIYPFMIFLITLGKPFIVTFFGVKWSGAVLPLQLLAFSVMIHVLVNSHAMLIRGLGKAKLEMRMQMVKAALYIPTISLGIYYYGIAGAAWAYIFNKILEVLIAQYYLDRLLHITFNSLIQTLKSTLIAGTVAFVATLTAYNLGINFYICVLLLGASYAGVIWLLMKDELSAHYKVLMQIKSKRSSTAI